ncbi:serine/arginine repetitive matrix protein 2, partial [Mantella aurantiaca]
MYNGIGLPTPRGSGTNGYVQRNLSSVRHKKDRTDYKSEEELKKLESLLVKKPNQEILDHERKRKVELKCLELEEMMEEQGYGEVEIQEKVATFRLMLQEKDVTANKEEEKLKANVSETHQLAEANEKKNEKLRAAFGISDSYIDGSSFNPSRREPHIPYSLVADSGSSRSPSPSKHKKKKKKKERGRSSSPSPSQREKKSKSTNT